jgi:hypothetical protein
MKKKAAVAVTEYTRASADITVAKETYFTWISINCHQFTSIFVGHSWQCAERLRELRIDKNVSVMPPSTPRA